MSNILICCLGNGLYRIIQSSGSALDSVFIIRIHLDSDESDLNVLSDCEWADDVKR